MFNALIGLLNMLCGFLVLYLVYQRYIQRNSFDKYDQEFFQRNNITSREDIQMFLYGFSGAFDIISSLTVSSAFYRMCNMITGIEFLVSAMILYFVTRVR